MTGHAGREGGAGGDQMSPIDAAALESFREEQVCTDC